jgi:tetratricopeptide (TPR) repeat protein
MFKFGNIPEAVGDFKVAETIAEKSNDEELKSRVYERLFYANFYIGSNTSVIKYARKLLNSSTHLNDSTMMLKSMLMCATAHADMDRMDSAYAYIKKGIKLKKDVDWFQLVDVDANGIRWYLTMAYIRKAQGQYDSAIELAKVGLTDIDQKTRMKSMQLLAELYEQTGDKKQAEETKMQLKEYEDSMKYVKLGMQMIDWQNTFDERQQTQEFYRQTAWMQGVITMIVILAALAIGIGLWLHRRKVRRLSHQLDEDAQSTNELRSKMGLLENRMERISNTLLIGTQMYNQLQQRQCIAEATAKEQQSLVDYFTQLRPKRWQEWQRKYNSLSTAQYVFLIMQDDLHYDDEAIANALNVKRTSVRSMRSRIKSRER